MRTSQPICTTINERICNVRAPCRVLYTAMLMGVLNKYPEHRIGRSKRREGSATAAQRWQRKNGWWIMAARALTRLVASFFNVLNLLTDNVCYPRQGHFQWDGVWSSLLQDDPEQHSWVTYIILSFVLNAPYDPGGPVDREMGDSIRLGQRQGRTPTGELTHLSESTSAWTSIIIPLFNVTYLRTVRYQMLYVSPCWTIYI